MKCLDHEEHEATPQWVTSTNAYGTAFTLRVLYCAQCKRGWCLTRKSDGSEGVAVFDMSVWRLCEAPAVS